MTSETPLERVLSDFATAMAKWGGRWYLIGARAVVFWGQVRNTEDIDVSAEVDPDDAPAFVEAMKSVGFEPRITDWHQFARETRTLLMEHPATDSQVDVIMAGPGLEGEFIDRAVQKEMGGQKFLVISAEDLVAAKILAGRPKDLEDAYGIVRKQGEALDLARVRSTLDWLATMLRRDDLRTTLDDLLDRLQGRTGSDTDPPRG